MFVHMIAPSSARFVDRRPFPTRLGAVGGSILLLAGAVGCGESVGPGPSSDGGGTGDDGTPVVSGYPELTAACRMPVETPTRFAVSSTDFSTGAVGLVDVASRSVRPDLALAQTDTSFAVDGDRLYVLNRFMFDFVDILDLSGDLALLGEFAVPISEERSSNPHDLHVTADQEAYVTVYGGDEVRVFDVADPDAVVPLRDVDLSAFADDDGIPEASRIIPCGDVAFVAVERLDRDGGWGPVDHTLLVPLGLGDDSLFDWRDARPGPDGIELEGTGLVGVRADPDDGTGHVILALTSGLERVDLAAGIREWVIPESAFSELGVGAYQLRSFDVRAGEAGEHEVYFVVASEDFSEHGIHRASLDGGGEDLEPVVGGLQTVTGSLEIVGDRAWFADTTVGASGIRVFDLAAEPVVQVGETLGTGLPPYALFPLP